MKPPKYTDNPARFAHVDLHCTNLAVTFARIRREQAMRERVERSAVPVPTNVAQLKRKS